VAVAQLPAAELHLLARRAQIDPEAKRPLVKAETRIDDVDVVVIFELRLDLLRLHVDRRFFSPLQLFLAEADVLHPHAQMVFFTRHDHNDNSLLPEF
jgi:hypothetical protein